MSRLRLLYPFLLALFPLLALAAGNAGDYTIGDLMAVCAALVGMVAVAYAVALLVVRALPGRTADQAAALVLAAVAWFYLYPPVQQQVKHLSRTLARHAILMPLLMLATLAFVAWLLRKPRRLVPLGSFLALAGLLLVARSAVVIAMTQGRVSGRAHESAFVRALEAPVPTAPAVAAAHNAPRRDIYVILLDGYANAEVLRQTFGYDNSRFEDSLRTLGFVIPRSVHSNYMQTFLSLPSFLNLAQVTPLTAEAGDPTKVDRRLPPYLIEHNRAARIAKAAGYKFVFFPSSWWGPTHDNHTADQEFRAWSGFNIKRQLSQTDLRRVWVSRTLLALVPKSVTLDTEHARRSFEGLKRVAADTAPTFTFAHFLLPHRPYLFDADCKRLDFKDADWNVPFGAPKDKAWYRGQVTCANRLTLDLVTTLLARSTVPPVIILQGDHGTMTLHPFEHAEGPTVAAARERFGAFGGYHLPGGGAQAMPDSVTVVNVLRYAFSYYLGAQLPPLPDSLFFSTPKRPFAFMPVDLRALATRPDTARATDPAPRATALR